MQPLLAALGARLSPPPVARRLEAADLPPALSALYAITDGAELPLAGWRILTLDELDRGAEDLTFTDAGHRISAEGRVTLGEDSFDGVDAFLRAVIERSEWAKPPTIPPRASATMAPPPAPPTPELIVQVRHLIEARGYRAILTGNRHELRLQGESGGSWYSIEPWVGRDEPGLAERIADRFVRRERARDVRWSVRCDEESLRTRDLSEVVSWAERPWRSLRVGCEVAEVALGLYRDDRDHLISFEWHGGRWQARARLTNWQVRATLEHLLLRRDKWPGLDWSLMHQPPS